MAMLDHPVPHAMSATLAGGSARSRASISGTAGSHTLPSRLRNRARFGSALPSGPQGIGGGAPPVRYACATSAIRRAARTISTPTPPA